MVSSVERVGLIYCARNEKNLKSYIGTTQPHAAMLKKMQDNGSGQTDKHEMLHSIGATREKCEAGSRTVTKTPADDARCTHGMHTRFLPSVSHPAAGLPFPHLTTKRRITDAPLRRT